MLPGGRHAELWVPGGLVSARAVQRLAGEATRDQERRAQALRKLGAKATTDHRRLARAQHRSLRRGQEAILEGDAELSERFSRLQVDWEKDAATLHRTLTERARRLEQRSLVHPALALSSLPLFAIFGRHNLQHHLTLLILLMIWLFGDEVTDLLSSQNDSESATSSRSPWWLYVSPAANLLAGWWLLHERQHESLITGTAAEFERVRRLARRRDEAPPLRQALELAKSVLAPCLADRERAGRYSEEYVAVVELAPYVAKDFQLDLLGLEEPPALAAVSSLTWSAAAEHRDPRVDSIAARVELGKLYITLTASASRRARRGGALIEDVRAAFLVKVLDEASLSKSV
jgi:hypothetical protein